MRLLLLLGVLSPCLGRDFQLVRSAAHQHCIEITHIVGNVEDDGVLDEAGFLHLGRIHHHIRQGDALLRTVHCLIETLHRGGNAPHHGDARYTAGAIDQPQNDSALGALCRFARVAHASVRFIQHQIQRQFRVFDGVANCVPDCVRTTIGAGFRKQQAGLYIQCFLIEPTHQQAVLAELLRIEEVNFLGLELRTVEGVFHHHQVGMANTV